MTIWQNLKSNAEKNQAKVLYRNGMTEHSMTYGQIFDLSGCLAGKVLPAESKQPLVVMLQNPDIVLPVLIACWKNSLLPAVLPVDTPPEKFSLINEVINAGCILTDAKLEEFEKICEIRKISEEDARIPDETKDNVFSGGEFSDSEPAVLMFSSGTTGVPKCIPWCFAQLNSNVKAFNSLLGINSDDVFLCSSPLSYSHGLYNSLLTAFFLGAEVIAMGVLSLMNADKALRAALKFKATVYHITPSMLSLMSMIGSRADYELPQFRYVICGTAKLEAGVKEKFEEVFPQPITQQYGMVETLFMAVNYKSQGEFPLSVGVPISKGLEVVDDQNIPVPVGQSGEVRVKITDECGEYYHQPEETNQVFREGSFYTGDVGVIDENSNLTITGRKKEIIKKGGFNINPHEINAVLKQFPGVKESVTIGMPDDLYGEEVYAFVSGSGELLGQEIIEFCSDKLQKNHLPKKIFQIDSFPVTNSGKVALAELGKIAENLINKGE